MDWGKFFEIWNASMFSCSSIFYSMYAWIWKRNQRLLLAWCRICHYTPWITTGPPLFAIFKKCMPQELIKFLYPGLKKCQMLRKKSNGWMTNILLNYKIDSALQFRCSQLHVHFSNPIAKKYPKILLFQTLACGNNEYGMYCIGRVRMNVRVWQHVRVIWFTCS